MWSVQVQVHRLYHPSDTPFLRNAQNDPLPNLRLLPSLKYKQCSGIRAVSASNPMDALPPNALRRKRDPAWLGGFSLGVDLGMSTTGLALSKGFVVRPLTVLKLRGEKLEACLFEIAQKQEVDEFIIGLPRSSDGSETPQSNKVRSVAGRLAVRAARRGWRVYLQDEHGTTIEANDRMINMGLTSSARHKKSDAYAAVMVLERYFSMSGLGVELVFPKNAELQELLRRGPARDTDLFPEDYLSLSQDR